MINATAIGQDLINLIAEEWIAQGHNMTGAFVASMTADSVNENGSLTINIYDNTQRGYGVILDNGVRPEQIKYTYAKARIAGLVLFVQARMGLSAEAALPVAFAIATKHKKEGMPTKDSEYYSKTGKRTGYVNDATQQEAIDAIVQNYVNDAVIL